MFGTADMIPVEVHTTMPKLDETADCDNYVIGHDSNKYAAKTSTDNPHYPFAPFDELFCYELAKHCSIAVPQYRVLRMPDGSLAFGSMWEGGVLRQGFILALDNYIKGDESKIEGDLLVQRISAVYALDMFVYNEDRHLGNYVVKDTGDRHVLMAMDFGRSWTSLSCPIDRDLNTVRPPVLPFCYLSPPHHTPGQPSKTFECAQFIWNQSTLGGLNGSSFFSVLNRLDSLPESSIRSILDKVPSEWCGEDRKLAMLSWWLSPDRHKRINAIKLGFQHGTLV